MMEAMADRAVDGTGQWVQDRFALGACILHTTAESFEAGQPHTNEDQTLALVMDGYLTNCQELRRDLTERGARLRNRSDAELVLRAYEQWGEDCAARIEGEFAFVIADRRNHRIYAARDHQGLRPLFYHQDGDALLIASDMRAIIATLDAYPAPDLDYLANFAMQQFWLRDQTPWAGLLRLPQSCWMAADGSKTRIHRYYELPTAVTQRYASEGEYAEHYRVMVFDVVRRTARSHAPLACAVSGGLDSSALFGVAHLLAGEGRLPAPGLQGYTMQGIAGSGSDELRYARAVTDHVDRALIEVPMFRPDEPWFRQQAAIDCDVPIPTNGAITILIEQQVALNGSRAFMQGTGGDEWLQGSGQYYREYFEEWAVSSFWRALLSDSRESGWRDAVPYALRSAVSGHVPGWLRAMVKARRRQRKWADPDQGFWLQPDWRARIAMQETAYDLSLPDQLGPWLKTNTFASPYGEFAKSRMQLQMAQNGIEARHPMYSRQFIEFSTTTPDYIKRQGLQDTKRVHRSAMRGILPDLVVDRQSKAYFESNAVDRQFGEFLAGDGKEAILRLCNIDGLSRLIAEHRLQGIDGHWLWEIWGNYASAAFLSLHRDGAFRSGR